MTRLTSSDVDRYAVRRLRNAINLNESDRRWCTESGGTIIYAVDNDIIKLYVDTAARALGNNGDVDGDGEREGGGYTRIFSGDKDTYIVGIGRILSHFIFFGRGNKDAARPPLLLVPPLDAEFATMFSGVFREAGKENHKAHQKIHEFDKLVKNREISDAEVARALVENATDVLKLLIGGETRHTELFRLCELINNGRILSLNEVVELARKMPSAFVANVDRKLSLLELIWLRDLSAEWFSRLVRSGDNDNRKKNLKDDADAMARLQVLNKRLEKENIRMIMITGASRVTRVAKKMIGRDSELSFADSWLRHPRGFLGEPDIFRGNPKLDEAVDTNRLPEMLDALLACEGHVKDEERNRSEENDSLYRAEMTKFQSNWDQLSARLCLVHSEIISSSNLGDKEVTELVARIRKADSSIKQFLTDAWHTAFLAAMQTGFLFSWSLRRDVRRNVPQLVFESFGEASIFVNDLLEQMQHSPGTEIENFQERIDKVKKDSSGGYTTYLVFGELFAAHDLWQVTSSLADSALRRVFPDTSLALRYVQNDKQRLITGREAYYLKAVAGRHLARSVTDLYSANEAILLAESMLEHEREFRGADLLAGDHRFRYEQCSINVAAAMFEKFLSIPGLGTDGMSVREIQDALDELLHSESEEMSELANRRGSLLESRILTSLFIVEVVLLAKPRDHFPYRLLTKLSRFRALYWSEHIGHPTKLSQVVFSIADCWGERNLDQFRKKKEKALDDINLSEKSLPVDDCMPYEIARHQYFKDFVASLELYVPNL